MEGPPTLALVQSKQAWRGPVQRQLPKPASERPRPASKRLKSPFATASLPRLMESLGGVQTETKANSLWILQDFVPYTKTTLRVIMAFLDLWES